MNAPNPSISFVSKCLQDLEATQAGKVALMAEEKASVMHIYPEGLESQASRRDVRVLCVSMLTDQLYTDIEPDRRVQ